MYGEPLPRYSHFSAAVGRHLCVYGGCTDPSESYLPWAVNIFSCDEEKWTSRKVDKGPSLPSQNLDYGACTSKDDLMFIHGGTRTTLHENNLFQLDCKYLKCTRLSSFLDPHAPGSLRGHGMVYSAQTDSLFTFDGAKSGQGTEYAGLVNEIHKFNLKEGMHGSIV